ncbi:hypothetical protein KAV67_02715 [Candidatus Bipolaricaulota bacterium]|nr:hypothetical protein [Candidatus Bipolaricaulota bacterium]
MSFEVDIPDDQLEYLGEAATEELRGVVKRFTVDVLDEAARLEANARTADRDPEVTSSNVHDASLILRKGLLARKQGRHIRIASGVGVVSGFLVGLLAEYDKLSADVGWLVGFLVLVTTAITAVVYVLMKE